MAQPQTATSSTTYLSVSELTRALNQLVEAHFFDVSFTGEISQCTLASSGHLYMTIKDEQSQIRSVMWRGNASRLTFQPEEGSAVLCTAKANIYSKSGQLQMIVTHMELAGKGDLHQKFLKLKAKLEKEGLFEAERKRALPFLPKSIGVVTSKSGAVIHDIMIKIAERMPQVQVYLIDVRVQGDGAAEEIAAAIDRFNALQNAEVLIVGRGGGSLEDLWPFNEEVVVRAIFRSKIPVISAVGHEVDVSLADLVADVRAPTPTAAAEIAVPHREQLLDVITKLERRLIDVERWLAPLGQVVDEQAIALNKALARLLDSKRAALENAALKVQAIRPSHLLQLLRERLAGHHSALQSSLKRVCSEGWQRIARIESRLHSASPSRRVDLAGSQIAQLERRLALAVSGLAEKEKLRVSNLASRLETLNYKKTLARGYSIVRSENVILTDKQTVKPQDVLDITLHRGKLSAIVSKVGTTDGKSNKS